MTNIAYFLLIIAQVNFSWQFQTYKAAVVEYLPIENRSASIEEITGGNVDEYINLLDSVASLGLDIIVFPESTITSGAPVAKREDYLRLATLVPNVSSNVIPCSTYNEYFTDYFQKLSCAARDANTYVVANLMEKSPCNDGICSQDKWNLYNTNVAFDRSGKIVARYRKFNLFGEYPLNKTEEADVTTFSTDFGVTFGMFTCFDLLFETPAMKLIRDGIKHIIFPTMWFSELPFLSALQAQNMWAVENNVVFLSAGANNPSRGSGGSGIFLGKYGPLEMDIIGTGGSKVYVKDILKSGTSGFGNEEISSVSGYTDELATDMDSFYFKLDDLSPYASEPLNLANKVTEELVCHEEFCCSFKVKIKNSVEEGQTYYQYRMVAFSGVRHFDVMDGGVDVCGLVACTNSSISSCGVRFPNYGDVSWPIRFEEIVVSGNFTKADHAQQFPNSLLSSIRPLNTNAYQWSSKLLEKDEMIHRTIRLLSSQTRLMTFGIYGRDVSRDSYGSGKSSFETNIFSLATLSVLYINLA